MKFWMAKYKEHVSGENDEFFTWGRASLIAWNIWQKQENKALDGIPFRQLIL